MVLDQALGYPAKVASAAAALLVTSTATLAVPYGFRMVIDKGFARGADVHALGHWFEMLLLIVVVLGIGTASRFYFVSWLGERVVADVRMKVQANLWACRPAFSRKTAPRKSPRA